MATVSKTLKTTVVMILMLAMLGASQLLIRFLLSQLNTLKDVMLHVEKTGDLSGALDLP